MEKFGRYELQRRIAAGGMAEIFLASTASIEGFQKQLIIKRMLPKWAHEKSFVTKFIDEAKLCAKLQHSNIVQVFDFGKHEDHYFLALEYIYGVDLAEIIREARRRKRRVPDALGAYIVEGICTGLDYAHEYHDPQTGQLRIVHRDISPGNVLVTFSGQIKVADFGIAIATGRSSSTEPGTIHGKVAYMSPEQARGEKLDRRTDLYSTGLILYELITNVRASQTPNVRELLRFAQHPKLQPAESFRDDLSPDLADIVRMALQPSRSERYQTGADFAEALQRYRVRHSALESSHTLGRFHRELIPEGPPEKRGADTRRKTKIVEPSVAAKQKSAKRVATEVMAETHANTAWERHAAPYLRRIIAEPNPWTLITLGKEALGRDLADIAQGLFRAASAKFTQQGLTLAALAAYRSLIDAGTDAAQVEKEIVRLRAMKGRPNADFAPFIKIDDALIDQVVGKILFDPSDDNLPNIVPEPAMVADLEDKEFLTLLRIAKLRHAPAGTVLLQEGQRAQSLFMLGTGRVILSAKDLQGESFTVEYLSHGDLFGEAGIFGASNRVTATAFDEVDYFEMKKIDLIRLAEELPNVSLRIEAVYQERAADALLWQSPLFGVLSARERSRLLEGAEFRDFDAGVQVVQEGATTDDIYIVKSGALGAYRGNKLVRQYGVNELFGEVSALRRVPQISTVRALAEGAETLVVKGGALWRLVRKNAEANKHFDSILDS